MLRRNGCTSATTVSHNCLSPQFSLAVFSKAPQHGRVKTRLQPVLPPTRCVTLHRQLLMQTLWQCRLTPGASVSLWTPPNSPSRLLRRAARRLTIRQCDQSGRDLGQRMHNAISSELRQSRHPVLLIGADCPFFTPDYFQRAYDALRRAPFVFGPASDGGFVLVGARRPLPSHCFDRIEWGGADVLERTLHNMKRAGAAYQLLPALDDIDRPEDLRLLNAVALHRMRWLFGVE